MSGHERNREEEEKERRLLLKIYEEVTCIHQDVKRILRQLALKKIDFHQVGGCHMPTDFSIQAGTSGSFAAVLTPSNGMMVGAPKWIASDSSITLSPSADGLTCDAAVPQENATDFDLVIEATSSDPNIGTVANRHSIHVVPFVPPPPPLTAIDFVQTA